MSTPDVTSSPDLWANLGLILAAGVAALGGYFWNKVFKPTTDPRGAPSVLAGIGMEFGSREQTERVITELAGIRKALEVLADKRTAEIEDIHKTLLERLDAQERRTPRR